MHTIAAELRDYLGQRVLKTAYFKFVIVSSVETLPNSISSDLVLDNTKAYRIAGNTFVTNNAVLTIPPGTILRGNTGTAPTSYLHVTRGARLIARDANRKRRGCLRMPPPVRWRPRPTRSAKESTL